ncbi:MAG: 6-bladed beta-propeller [Candidatus Aminicenantes bacterium]|nr:MAG: 6-bladed beta-propeller [Candidatus Aminicenantes bacterium]
MRKTALLFSFILIFNSVILAQAVIENPEKPLGKNAGRIVQLKEIYRIIDENGKYFFRRPHNFQVAPNGDLFIQDREQLLQFDSKGNFIRNLYKKGQGPGEVTSIRGYQLTETEVIIHSDSPSKILKFDYEGNMLKEMPINQKKRFYTFEFYYYEQYYFLYIDWEQIDKLEGVVGFPYKLVSLFANGEILTEYVTFPTKSVLAVKGGIRGGWVPVDRLITIPWQERYLVISHTEEYLLTLFDAESQQIVRRFKRKYPRIKATDKNDKRPNLSITLDRQKFQAPKRNYLYDIEQLWVNGEFLWVLTSTIEEGKGYMVDVFDINGVYTDMFFLKVPKKATDDYFGLFQMAISGEFFYATEKDKDDNYVIKKYRILDGNRLKPGTQIP